MIKYFLLVVAYSVSLSLFQGCATSTKKPTNAPIIYPAPPDKARYVFERTLRYSDSVTDESTYSSFKRFAVGQKKKLKGLVKPYGIAVKKGRVYVTDTVQRKVFLFDIHNRRFLEIGHQGKGALTKPIGVDVSNDDKLYVADVSARKINVYTLDGKFIKSIGGKKWLARPVSASVSNDGNYLYVVDVGGISSEKHQVQVFDTDSGLLVQTIGKRGTDKGQFNLPIQSAIGPKGNLYVVDKGNFRVQSFDQDGKYINEFGHVGRFPGQFFSPKGISVDSKGRIYVVDTSFGNFQIFNAKGELLMFIGSRGQSGKPGVFSLPAGIDVDEDGRIYVVDQFFRKVDVFRPVELKANEGFAAIKLQ